MPNLHDPPEVLTAWSGSLTPRFCEFLDNAGGFSGAKFWRIRSLSGDFCLRRWPQEHPTPERLAWIHAVIEHAARLGSLPLAVALRTNAGKTFAEHDGHLWELTPWLPGEPYDFLQRVELGVGDIDEKDHVAMKKYFVAHCQLRGKTLNKIANATKMLANFHQATARFPLNLSRFTAASMTYGDQPVRNWGVSPGLQERWKKMQHLQSSPWLNDLRTAVVQSGVWPTGVPLSLEIIDTVSAAHPSVTAVVEPCLKLQVQLQPCLRDIWSDHFLFTKDDVTGMIDYGAMRIENRFADLARFLGSILSDEGDRVVECLRTYDNVYRWNSDEEKLLDAFMASSVLLSGLNWIEWIFVEQRDFPDMKSIERRMQGILARLRRRVNGPDQLR